MGLAAFMVISPIAIAQDDESGVNSDAGSETASELRLEEYRLRFTFFHQDGTGYQSQDGPAEGPGSERLLVFQPMAYFRIRQNREVVHQITAPVDVVSSASADALDAVSSASRENEAGGLDVSTQWSPDADHQITARYGFHLEEPLRSFFVGAGYQQSFAEQNTTIDVSGNLILDFFDPITPRGNDLGFTERASINGNISLTQILSRTTLGSLSYGLTFQTGTLETTWNSTPRTDAARRIDEQMPGTRRRHAVSGLLAQHIPSTRSTLRLHYRYYRDDFDLSAHSARVEWYQYLGDRLLLRAHYRVHQQSGVSFFGRSFTGDLQTGQSLTSDSDLAPFTAHEGGARVMILFPPSDRSPSRDRLDVDYLYYRRSNNLVVHQSGISYGRLF